MASTPSWIQPAKDAGLKPGFGGGVSRPPVKAPGNKNTGGLGGSTKAPSSLEDWVNRYKGYQQTATANLKEAQTLLAQEQKKKKPNSERVKFYQDRIKSLGKDMAKYKSDISDTQNKIYMRDGQYDQLLTGENRDAFLAISTLFKSYGLSTLAGKIFDYVKNGYSADTISILLSDTPEYKTRFAGNEARLKAGLPVLSPGEYLATEASYRQIMESAGLPPGFYDQPGDFSGWIGKNVSPSEIQTRVDLATQATTLANPNYRKALNELGIKDSELTAYFLDSTKALPYLQKAAATAAIGGEALGHGLTFDKAYSEELALKGISADEAQQGYSQVATELDTYKTLGAIYGEQWSQRESEESVFEGKAGAIKKKTRLQSQERGAFGGATGGGRGGLSQSGGAR